MKAIMEKSRAGKQGKINPVFPAGGGYGRTENFRRLGRIKDESNGNMC